MFQARFLPLLAIMLALGACAERPPTGPGVLALPSQSKTLAQFQQDDANCRGYAQQQLGSDSAGGLQQHYDDAYAQCMVASGDRVQPAPVTWPDAPYGYAYPSWAYPYGAYNNLWSGPAVGLGFFGGFGPRFHHHHGFHHGFGHHAFGHHGSHGR